MKSTKIIVPKQGVALIGAEFEANISDGSSYYLADFSELFTAYEVFTPEALSHIVGGFFTVIRPDCRATTGFDYQHNKQQWAELDFYNCLSDAYNPKPQTEGLSWQFHRYHGRQGEKPISTTTDIPTRTNRWKVLLSYSHAAALALPDSMRDLARVHGHWMDALIFGQEGLRFSFLTHWSSREQAETLEAWAKTNGVYLRTEYASDELLDSIEKAGDNSDELQYT